MCCVEQDTDYRLTVVGSKSPLSCAITQALHLLHHYQSIHQIPDSSNWISHLIRAQVHNQVTNLISRGQSPQLLSGYEIFHCLQAGKDRRKSH